MNLKTLPRSDRRKPSRWNQTPVPARVAERAFLSHEVEASGCWISTYSVMNSGYAQIGWGGESRGTVLAHRASWVHVNGQVPIGMTLDHMCKNRRCVNPGHLRLLSNYENARRNNGTDWEFGQCRNGHPDSCLREIQRTAKSGRQYMGLTCGECNKAAKEKWLEVNPEKRAAIVAVSNERSRDRRRAWYQANREVTIARARESKERRRKAREIPAEIQVDYI